MVTLPEPESGTKRPKLTTPKYGAFAMVLSGAISWCYKQQSKVADLGKYVHLPEVGTFQVSISVTKS